MNAITPRLNRAAAMELVENAALDGWTLVAHAADQIRTQRFAPSGEPKDPRRLTPYHRINWLSA